MVSTISGNNIGSNDPVDSNEQAVMDIEVNRLFWHSRRGMLELDLLLVPFLKEAYRSLPKEDRDRYQDLLTNEDPDMFSWFMKRETPEDPDTARIVKIILDRVQPK